MHDADFPWLGRPALWILLGGTIAAALSLCVGGPRFTGMSACSIILQR
jgi:hypothetical protein